MAQTFGFMLYVLGLCLVLVLGLESQVIGLGLGLVAYVLGLGLAICVLDSITVYMASLSLLSCISPLSRFGHVHQLNNAGRRGQCVGRCDV